MCLLKMHTASSAIDSTRIKETATTGEATIATTSAVDKLSVSVQESILLMSLINSFVYHCC